MCCCGTEKYECSSSTEGIYFLINEIAAKKRFVMIKPEMLRKKNQPKSRPSGKYWIGRTRSCRRGRAALQFR